MDSGMYSVDTTMHILFNDGSSELAFTSTSGNAFITKIVIKYDSVGEHGESAISTSTITNGRARTSRTATASTP